MRRVSLLLAFAFVLTSSPLCAGRLPSKASTRLDSVAGYTDRDAVVHALADRGFTSRRIEESVDRLSAADLRELSQNTDQLQSAGISRVGWVWLGVAALAPIAIVSFAESIGP